MLVVVINRCVFISITKTNMRKFYTIKFVANIIFFQVTRKILYGTLKVFRENRPGSWNLRKVGSFFNRCVKCSGIFLICSRRLEQRKKQHKIEISLFCTVEARNFKLSGSKDMISRINLALIKNPYQPTLVLGI